MTIQQHASFDSSSAELNATSKLVKAWESKNAKNAAKAGGVSLMALSLAACGGSDETAAVVPVDITSDNADFLLAAVTAVDATAETVAEVASNANAAGVETGVAAANDEIDQAIADAGITVADDATSAEIIAAVAASDNATVTAAALTTEAGTSYATVDAAVAAGSNTSNGDAVTAALTDANGVAHNNVDVAITSNDAAIETAATNAAEATLVAGSGFDTVAALKAAYDLAVAPEGAVTPSLSTSRDIPTMSGADDTVTGIYQTLTATDVISDGSGTDSDTLTAVFDLNSATTFTTINVETINLDLRSATNTTLDLANVTGTNTVNLYSNYGYNPAALTIDNIESGMTVDIATSIALTAAEIVTLQAGADVHTSAVTLNMNGDEFTLATQSGATDDIDLLTINSGGAAANALTLNGDNSFAYAASNANSITLTGDQNITIKATDATFDTDDLFIVDNTTGGTSTLEVTEAAGAGASNDYTNVDVDVFSLKGALNATDAFVVNSGARFDLDSNFSAGVNAIDLAISTAATASSITVNLDTSNTSAGANNAGITLTEFNTVNLGNTSAAATTLDGALALAVAGIGEEVDLNIDTGTSAGITITGSTTATTGTLDTVSITGASAFVQTGAMTAANVNSTTTHDVTFTAALTGDTVIDMAATRTLDIDNGISGSFTLTGAGTADIEGTVGEASGIINITSTGSTDIQGAVTGALTAAISADKTLNLQGATNGAVVLSGDGDFAVAGLTTGAVNSTLGGELNFAAITGDSVFTLTENTGTVDELDVTGAITGDITVNGSGNADLDGAISGGLTVGGSVDVDLAAGIVLSGALTATGSGNISVEIAGAVVAGTASGDITTTGSGTQSGSIVTGSGDDSITLANGDDPVSISTGDGNDTIDAALGAAAVSIDAGAGVDSITGSAAADELTGGFGTDTFVMTFNTDMATSAGVADTIKDFAFGNSGDVLNLTSFTAPAGGVDGLAGTSASVASAASTVDLTTESIVAITDSTAANYSDVATIIDAAVVSASGEDAVFLVTNGTDARVYGFKEAGGDTTVAAGELTVIATLSGVTDFTDIVDSNFAV